MNQCDTEIMFIDRHHGDMRSLPVSTKAEGVIGHIGPENMYFRQESY